MTDDVEIATKDTVSCLCSERHTSYELAVGECHVGVVQEQDTEDVVAIQDRGTLGVQLSTSLQESCRDILVHAPRFYRTSILVADDLGPE